MLNCKNDKSVLIVNDSADKEPKICNTDRAAMTQFYRSKIN